MTFRLAEVFNDLPSILNLFFMSIMVKFVQISTINHA